LSDIDDYARMQRNYYDSMAVDIDDARALVHPDYAYAAAQAPGFIRFVLNSYYAVHVRDPARAEHASRLERTKRVLRIRPALLRELALRLLAMGKQAPAHEMPSALDFGCGVGRLMRPYSLLGGRVDGVDVSRKMLEYARADGMLSGSRFFEASGYDCGAAPTGAYDIVYSAICMQHIASRTARQRILKDMRRVLRDGGMVAIQFHHYPDIEDRDIPRPHVAWNVDEYDAVGTNSEADVWITPQSLPMVIADFRACFNDVAASFCEFPAAAKLFRGAYGEHRFEHVILTATAGLTRAEAIYAV